jgi:hypothetical protein
MTTTQQATSNTSNTTTKTTFKFKVGDDLEVINKVIRVLNLTPSDYVYNAKEGIITTDKTTITKEFIQQTVKSLDFDFFSIKDNNKDYKSETITTTVPYINPASIDIAITNLHKQYKYREDISLIETKINYVDKTVTVSAKAKIKSFSNLDYKVALVLTNFSYVTSTNNKSTTSSTTEQEVAYDEIYKSIDKLIDRVGSDFNKSAPPELKTFVRLFL